MSVISTSTGHSRFSPVRKETGEMVDRMHPFAVRGNRTMEK